ncbi:MAG: NADPH-dependent FMN reductase, partial [Sneathiella sp.]
MRLLGLSGSLRRQSTNKVLLEGNGQRLPDSVHFDIFPDLDKIAIFNPDREGENATYAVESLMEAVLNADGLIIACPEYAHGIPGGLKNALDWLVSSPEFPGKPIMLAHASHRGTFVLAALKEVLRTMSAEIVEEAFLQIPLMSYSPEAVR